MKSIIKDFAKVCYVLLVLISTKAISQENQTFTISDGTIKHMKSKYLKTYSILQDKIINTKRPVLFIGEEIVDSNEIIGSYSILPNKYHYARRDDRKGNYIEDELVDLSNNFDDSNLSQDVTYLIYKNVSTGKLYVIREEYLKSIANYDKTQELVKIVHKLGYKEYSNPNDSYDENLYIKSKTCEIKLDNWTYKGLKKNPSYIATLDNDQMKLDALINQTITHSKTLDKYLGLYRIQRNKMSSTNISAWKTATLLAQKLNNQIVNLDEKYAGNYSFMPLKKLSNVRENFSNNLGASKGVLGM